MKLIWATRGRTWGFRFLDDGGFPDPLVEHDRHFAGLGNSQQAFRRSDGAVALRFPDPLGRHDRSGRVISHEFVVFRPDADRIDSVETGCALVWPLVAERFADRWALPDPEDTTN